MAIKFTKVYVAMINEAEAMNMQLGEVEILMASELGGEANDPYADENTDMNHDFTPPPENQDDADDIEDVVSILEAEDSAVTEEAPVLEPQATDVDGDPRLTFDEVLQTISSEEKLAAVKAMANAIDERSAFEAANGNENIQKTLDKARRAFTLPSAGAVLLACGTDEAFVNRSMHDGKRYNVYAMGKLADITNALNGGLITNQINNAIMRSLFAFRRAGVAFTGDMAKAAASDKIRVDNAMKAILVRHTVSASTAPTQASSTLQAMETLGLVTRSGHKNPVFELTDAPAVAKLEEALAKAA